VTFLRRVEGVLQHCPEDLPRDEVQTWSQVMERWGGGDYQAIAKTDKHVVIRHYPNKGEWMSLDGEPLPFVKRGARQATAAHATRAPEETAPPAAPPALPAGMDEVLGAVTKLADRLDRMQERMAAAPQSGGNEVMIAMIMAQASRDAATTQAQATVAAAEARARAEAQVAMAEAIAENNQSLLGVLTKGGDGFGELASLLAMLKPEAVQPVQPQDPLAVLQKYKALGLLGVPAAASVMNELKPIVDAICGAITERIQADCQARVAEAEVRMAKLQAGRALGEPPRLDHDRPPLVYVPGLGMVFAPVAPAGVVQLPASSAPAPSAPVTAPVASAAPSAPPRPVEPAAQPPSPPTVAAQLAPAECIPQIPDSVASEAASLDAISSATAPAAKPQGAEDAHEVSAPEETLRRLASVPAMVLPEFMPARRTANGGGAGPTSNVSSRRGGAPARRASDPWRARASDDASAAALTAAHRLSPARPPRIGPGATSATEGAARRLLPLLRDMAAGPGSLVRDYPKSSGGARGHRDDARDAVGEYEGHRDDARSDRPATTRPASRRAGPLSLAVALVFIPSRRSRGTLPAHVEQDVHDPARAPAVHREHHEARETRLRRFEPKQLQLGQLLVDEEQLGVREVPLLRDQVGAGVHIEPV
jgi:hypothetical protein